MNDPHAPLLCSFEIDRGIPSPRRGDHTKLGQALDDSTRHRRGLPPPAHGVEWLKALANGPRVRAVGLKNREGRPPIHLPPLPHLNPALFAIAHDPPPH